MTITIDRDAIDPIVGQIGRLAGILHEEDAGFSVNEDFFRQPLDELRTGIQNNQDALLQLLASIFRSSSAELLGLVGPNAGETWYSLDDDNGAPTGLYVVVGSEPGTGTLRVGFGVRYEQTIQGITVSLWAHVPILETQGSLASTAFVMGQGSFDAAGAPPHPVQLALEITQDQNGIFGTADLGFRGIRLAGQLLFDVNNANAPAIDPRISFVFLDLRLPNGDAPADRSLADLTATAPREWIEMAIGLLTAQLSITNAPAALAHVLPIVGLPTIRAGIGAALPSIAWEQFPARGGVVVTEWFRALIDDASHFREWLDHWRQLLGGGGNAAINVQGGGSRADPWRVGVQLAGTQVELYLTFAYATDATGARLVYPGLRVAAPVVVISGTTAIRFEAVCELAECRLASPVSFTSLPTLRVETRLYDTGGDLVNHQFPQASPLAPLGRFIVGELRFGLALDDNKRPTPFCELENVRSAVGNWPEVDLSSANAIMEGLGAAAQGAIAAQLDSMLGAGAANHAGRNIAALLGVVPPTDAATPANWAQLVPLAVSVNNVGQFLGDPLGAIACYHSRCLTTQVGGAPAWRFLLPDLFSLLHDASVPGFALTGSGSIAQPWRLPLYTNANVGDAELRAWVTNAGGSQHLTFALDLAPASITLNAAPRIALALHVQAQVIRLDLPPPANCAAPIGADWFPSVAADLSLRGNPIGGPQFAGVSLTANVVLLGCTWCPEAPAEFDWHVSVEGLHADWSGTALGFDGLTLPPLRFGSAGSGEFDIDWDFSVPDLGLGLSFPDGNRLQFLLQLLVGRWLLERGGSFGFGIAGLLGLLPNLPDFEHPDLPDWMDGPFALPGDWPTFDIPDLFGFLADPWASIRFHIGRLLTTPRWALPALRWIGATFHASLPDLSLPDLGWPLSGGGAGLPRLTFPTVPFVVTGDGTYAEPWAISINRAGARAVEALVWLEPDGPKSDDAVDVALALLPNHLRSLPDLAANLPTYAELAQILVQVATLDVELRTALHGIDEAELANAFQALDAHFATSDGIVSTASQQPANAPWNAAVSPPLTAYHGAQLGNNGVVAEIKNRIDAWSAALPVLFVGAPWESSSAWKTVLQAFAMPAPATRHFNLRESGVAPEKISFGEVTDDAAGGVRFYTADIAVFNTAPGIATTDRAIPVEASQVAGEWPESQAQQVSRLIDHVRLLHNGAQVIVVAHSSAGLAARAAVNRDADNTRVFGVITIGTPHAGADLS